MEVGLGFVEISFQKRNKSIEFENIKRAVTTFDSIIGLVAPKLDKHSQKYFTKETEQSTQQQLINIPCKGQYGVDRSCYPSSHDELE